MPSMNDDLAHEIAQVAARWIAEEGMDYASAKRQAVADLGLPPRTALPRHELVEAAVREHLALFCADTQPEELRVLRQVALRWMQRLEAFRPHVSGAVWRGTATRHQDVRLELFCDDPKSLEIFLIDHNQSYEVSQIQGFQGETVDALSVSEASPAWPGRIWIHLIVHDHDDLRGALRADTQGRTWRGDRMALERLLQGEET
jgi:hypothetical protein